MDKLKNTMSISKGDEMSGIGVDQSALLEDSEFRKSAEKPEPQPDINERQINNMGGPSYGRDSKIPEHKSGVLNALDPRIGYTVADHEESVAKYEEKYGKPHHDSPREVEKRASENMAGFGADQSALVDNGYVDSAGHK